MAYPPRRIEPLSTLYRAIFTFFRTRRIAKITDLFDQFFLLELGQILVAVASEQKEAPARRRFSPARLPQQTTSSLPSYIHLFRYLLHPQPRQIPPFSIQQYRNPYRYQNYNSDYLIHRGSIAFLESTQHGFSHAILNPPTQLSKNRSC